MTYIVFGGTLSLYTTTTDTTVMNTQVKLRKIYGDTDSLHWGNAVVKRMREGGILLCWTTVMFQWYRHRKLVDILETASDPRVWK